MKLIFTLPWPPSVNAIWRTPSRGKLAGRTMLSEEARSYRKSVGEQIMIQAVRRHALMGRLGVSLEMHPPTERKFDIDNFCKAAFDALQYCAVIEDDGHIDELHIYRREVVKGGRLNLVIWELQEKPCETSATPTSCTRAQASRSALYSLARLEASLPESD